MPELGSFAGNLGQDPQRAIQAAIQARQQGGQPVGALNQTTPAAPGGQSPVPGAAPQGQVAPLGGQEQKPPPSEAEIIEKALASRLSSLSKVEEAQVIPPKPQTPGAPQAAPVGGGSPYRRN